MTTNRHGVAAFDFATVSGCGQLVVGPTHANDGTLDLLMIIVPDLVQVAVVVQLGPWITHFSEPSFRRHKLIQTCVLVGKFF